MENELTFVAPEGVYSVTEGYRPIPAAHDVLALNTIHSFTRVYVKDRPEPSQMSKEITVFPRDSESGAFSRHGDSGLAVIDGKGSAGSTDESDCAYLMVLTSVDFLCERMLDHGVKANLSPPSHDPEHRVLEPTLFSLSTPCPLLLLNRLRCTSTLYTVVK